MTLPIYFYILVLFVSSSTSIAFTSPYLDIGLVLDTHILQHRADARARVVTTGYLDDFSNELYQPSDEPNIEEYSLKRTKMNKEDIDQYAPGNFNQYVDFNEFDGGDGQMGVAGDGQKGIDKSDFNLNTVVTTNVRMDREHMNSKLRSARVAWGTTAGYADTLIKEKGMDTARAHQLENWQNQQEVTKKIRHENYVTDQPVMSSPSRDMDANWRTMAKFGAEKNENFDLQERFGPIRPDGNNVLANDSIHLTAHANGGVGMHVLSLSNPYMGFADFRAAFTDDTLSCWSVIPNEGTLHSKKPTDFHIKFRPESSGTFEGQLVIETEDTKQTWHVVGTTG